MYKDNLSHVQLRERGRVSRKIPKVRPKMLSFAMAGCAPQGMQEQVQAQAVTNYWGEHKPRMLRMYK